MKTQRTHKPRTTAKTLGKCEIHPPSGGPQDEALSNKMKEKLFFGV
jgi:hypothetical protein